MASYDAGTLTNQSKRSARIYKDLNLRLSTEYCY